jgi:hypothetical protein
LPSSRLVKEALAGLDHLGICRQQGDADGLYCETLALGHSRRVDRTKVFAKTMQRFIVPEQMLIFPG